MHRAYQGVSWARGARAASNTGSCIAHIGSADVLGAKRIAGLAFDPRDGTSSSA